MIFDDFERDLVRIKRALAWFIGGGGVKLWRDYHNNGRHEESLFLAAALSLSLICKNQDHKIIKYPGTVSE